MPAWARTTFPRRGTASWRSEGTRHHRRSPSTAIVASTTVRPRRRRVGRDASIMWPVPPRPHPGTPVRHGSRGRPCPAGAARPVLAGTPHRRGTPSPAYRRSVRLAAEDTPGVRTDVEPAVEHVRFTRSDAGCPTVVWRRPACCPIISAGVRRRIPGTGSCAGRPDLAARGAHGSHHGDDHAVAVAGVVPGDRAVVPVASMTFLCAGGVRARLPSAAAIRQTP
jgi:hypothetical protein